MELSRAYQNNATNQNKLYAFWQSGLIQKIVILLMMTQAFKLAQMHLSISFTLTPLKYLLQIIV